jgi:transcriptional regulator with XRE-family HTH domain
MKPRTGPRERARLARQLRLRIGRQILELRTEAGVSRSALARCAGVDRSHILRIEAGEASPSLDSLVAISTCLGAEAAVRLFPAGGPRIHDRFQAPMVETLVRSLGPSWRATPEVPVPAARGVIDIVLTRATDQCTVACECHSELRRIELILRRAAEKAGALGPQSAGGADASTLLAIRSTESTRAIARACEATLAAAFPARSADAVAALTGTAPWPGAAIVWVVVEGGRGRLLQGPPRGVRLGR